MDIKFIKSNKIKTYIEKFGVQLGSKNTINQNTEITVHNNSSINDRILELACSSQFIKAAKLFSSLHNMIKNQHPLYPDFELFLETDIQGGEDRIVSRPVSKDALEKYPLNFRMELSNTNNFNSVKELKEELIMSFINQTDYVFHVDKIEKYLGTVLDPVEGAYTGEGTTIETTIHPAPLPESIPIYIYFEKLGKSFDTYIHAFKSPSKGIILTNKHDNCPFEITIEYEKDPFFLTMFSIKLNTNYESKVSAILVYFQVVDCMYQERFFCLRTKLNNSQFFDTGEFSNDIKLGKPLKKQIEILRKLEIIEKKFSFSFKDDIHANFRLHLLVDLIISWIEGKSLSASKLITTLNTGIEHTDHFKNNSLEPVSITITEELIIFDIFGVFFIFEDVVIKIKDANLKYKRNNGNKIDLDITPGSDKFEITYNCSNIKVSTLNELEDQNKVSEIINLIH